MWTLYALGRPRPRHEIDRGRPRSSLPSSLALPRNTIRRRSPADLPLPPVARLGYRRGVRRKCAARGALGARQIRRSHRFSSWSVALLATRRRRAPLLTTTAAGIRPAPSTAWPPPPPPHRPGVRRRRHRRHRCAGVFDAYLGRPPEPPSIAAAPVVAAVSRGAGVPCPSRGLRRWRQHPLVKERGILVVGRGGSPAAGGQSVGWWWCARPSVLLNPKTVN